MARSCVQSADAAWRPQVSGFGSHNLNSRHALLPDPDWIVGIGVHFTLSGNIDRSQAQGAARAREPWRAGPISAERRPALKHPLDRQQGNQVDAQAPP
jgi:hypothetical protein